ncbi:MAG: hypothetical protein QM775_14425 [Pirellulales bacterium]
MRSICVGAALCLLSAYAERAAAGELEVGFAAADVTPELRDDRPVWVAGYGPGRRATGVHDPLMARAIVLADGETRVAIVGVDSIGLQLPTVRRIRERLADYAYVLVASTHDHEAPDVIGIWVRDAVSIGRRRRISRLDRRANSGSRALGREKPQARVGSLRHGFGSEAIAR